MVFLVLLDLDLFLRDSPGFRVWKRQFSITTDPFNTVWYSVGVQLVEKISGRSDAQFLHNLSMKQQKRVRFIGSVKIRRVTGSVIELEIYNIPRYNIPLFIELGPSIIFVIFRIRSKDSWANFR